MKRKVIFILVLGLLLFNLVIFVGAEGPIEVGDTLVILAKDNKVVLGDAGCGECSVESIEMVLEGSNKKEGQDNYVSRTIEDRKFDPSKMGMINPFDDVEVIVNVKCDGNSKFHYDSLEFYYIDEEGSEVILGEEVRLVEGGTRNKETGEKEYKFFIQGWPGGWGTAYQQEPSSGDFVQIFDRAKLSDFSSLEDKDRKLGIRIINGEEVLKDEKFFISSCVKLWGSKDAEFKFVNLKAKSVGGWMAPSEFVGNSIGFYEAGFNEKDPFKDNKDKFSYYADLKVIDDEKWPTVSTFHTGGISKFYLSTQGKLEDKSICGDDGDLYILHEDITTNPYTPGTNVKSIFFSYKSIIGLFYPEILVHETGHAFCGIWDEYKYTWIPFFDFVLGKNCRFIEGSFGEYGGDYTGCSQSHLYKSTLTSIMDNELSPNLGAMVGSKFNIVSCGYCLAKIKEGKTNLNDEDMEKYWEECKEMDTLRDEGISCNNDAQCSINQGDVGCAVCGPGDKCINGNIGDPCKRQYNSDYLTYGSCDTEEIDGTPVLYCLEDFVSDCNELGGCEDGKSCDLNTHLCV